jgi:hypothetical protein
VLRRVAASLSVGAALNFASAGIALAPSTAARADVVANTIDARIILASLPVAEPIPLPALLLHGRGHHADAAASPAAPSDPLKEIVLASLPAVDSGELHALFLDKAAEGAAKSTGAAPVIAPGRPASEPAKAGPELTVQPAAVARIEPVEAEPLDDPEAVEIHRNDVRRLLAEGDGARDPNELIQFGRVRIPRQLVEAILRASEETGVDPVYMMALADKESSFSADVKASTSSAEGLFQFINRTWIELVREFGPKYGLEEEASAIEIVGGEAKILEEDVRDYVLGLRRDPYLSAIMAAEMLKKDRALIAQRIGRDLRNTEFYLAHFFGVEEAGKFMKLLDGKPKQSAPKVFPAAAKANKPLFFVRNGKKTKDLTVAQVYDKIDRMMDSRIGRYRGVTALMSFTASAGDF